MTEKESMVVCMWSDYMCFHEREKRQERKRELEGKKEKEREKERENKRERQYI